MSFKVQSYAKRSVSMRRRGYFRVSYLKDQAGCDTMLNLSMGYVSRSPTEHSMGATAVKLGQI